MARAGVGRSEVRNATTTRDPRRHQPRQQHHPVGLGGGRRRRWSTPGARINSADPGQLQPRPLEQHVGSAQAGTVDMIINGQTARGARSTESALHRQLHPPLQSQLALTAPSASASSTSPCSTGASTIAPPTAARSAPACLVVPAAAQLSSVEKRHIFSGVALTYSPVPGMIDIKAELDYYDRQVQATNTGANAWGTKCELLLLPGKLRDFGVSTNPPAERLAGFSLPGPTPRSSLRFASKMC